MEQKEQKEQEKQEKQEETQESLIHQIVFSTCTCNAWSEQDHRCEHLENCVFKTNK